MRSAASDGAKPLYVADIKEPNRQISGTSKVLLTAEICGRRVKHVHIMKIGWTLLHYLM
jgi:hypothetical protein